MTTKGISLPNGTSRVEDGKIKKIKASIKSEKPAVQQINGKTYACESCKRGHRVHKCDHGKTRPISETNQPGRPSAGQKRGCQCPRNCACTTKTCKCERDCSCTQEMFLIVRLDNPTTIVREATSTPKPVWEDANGNTLTLKKVWADANGKEIGAEEYEERKRRLQERQEATSIAPASSCCSSKTPQSEPDSPPQGGCRHRQNVAAIQPHPGPQLQVPVPQHPQRAKQSLEPWMATCTCGTGCSCLYCPDHPNNATSINHTQQQIKNFAQQAYTGSHVLTPVPSIDQSSSRSCMGGQPSFFLSSTPQVSQNQLQQFFSDTLNPNAIYLAYPIQQHSWTNRPASSHCSHIHSPPVTMTMSPSNPDMIAPPLPDLSADPAIADDVDGIWDFSNGQLGANSFSWTDLNASHGTDYNIGQATVASVTQSSSIYDASLAHQPVTNTTLGDLSSPPFSDAFANALPQLGQTTFIDFDMPLVSDGSLGDLDTNLFIPTGQPASNIQHNLPDLDQITWQDHEMLSDPGIQSTFSMQGISRSDSPIVSRV
jgi:hypothetical protein